MESLFKTMQILCDLPGTSGDEGLVRNTILKMIEGHYETAEIDPLGNLFVYKKGKQVPKKRLMAEAHMDEVGFMVTAYQDSGMLHFTSVGGVDPRVALGRRVYFPAANIYGVIGYKAIHMLKADERDQVPGYDTLCIDIGAKSLEEAKNHIELGAVAVFDSRYEEFGTDKIKAKAIDDRAGCAILVEIIRGEVEYDTMFAFSVQEEVGCRGAKVGAYTVNPDYAIVVESTTAADIGETPENDTVCTQGKGAVLSWADNGTVYDRKLVEEAFQIAKNHQILVQPKRAVAGGNDAGSIHSARGGVKTIALSLPCRYLHSQSSVVQKSDVVEELKMVKIWLTEMGKKVD